MHARVLVVLGTTSQLLSFLREALGNCREVHLIDILANHKLTPDVIRVHCSAKSGYAIECIEGDEARHAEGHAVHLPRPRASG